MHITDNFSVSLKGDDFYVTIINKKGEKKGPFKLSSISNNLYKFEYNQKSHTLDFFM